jgi:phage baseplate assembly protein gpV
MSVGANNSQWKDILDLHFDKRLRDFVHTSFPAKITRINSNNTVDVLPLISTLRPDGSNLPYQEIFDVRMQTYACQLGDVFVSLPIRENDPVWVMVSERDVSKLMTTDGSITQQSTTQATHDLSDCFCIPAFFPDGLAKEFDKDALVIANKSSTIRVTDNGIEITTDNASIRASELSIDADNIVVNATLQVNGDSSFNGSVEASGGTFKHNGKDVGSTHKHIGVRSGTDVSGIPQ